jgi:hypothetical protein
MEHSCFIHPTRRAFSVCHSCGRSFCSDCLVEGDEFYYCRDEACQNALSQDALRVAEERKIQSVKGDFFKMVANFYVLGLLISALFIWYGFNTMSFRVNLRGCFIVFYGMVCVIMIVISWFKHANRKLRVVNFIVFLLGIIDVLWLENFDIEAILHAGVDDTLFMSIAFPILLINWIAIHQISKKSIA